MNLQQYKESGKSAYAEFASIVARILESSIQEHAPHIRVQAIQKRAKDIASLGRKIESRTQAPDGAISFDAERIEDDIKDLAGVRVVLYSNGDVYQFSQSSIIRGNFEIDPRRTKLHHPNPDDGEDANEFRSTNYVVTLKDNRTSLPEFARFANMRCEIQIQTILDHAWSETAHDITYKGFKADGYGSRELEKLRVRLNNIMRKHLEPAGRDFQQVWDTYQRLLAGKSLIDSDALSRLIGVENNNERLDLLRSIGEQYISNLDDYGRQYPEIREILTKSALAAISTPTRQRISFDIAFDGVTPEEYLEEALKYIREYMIADLTGTLDDIFVLYRGAQTDNQRQKITDFGRTFSSPNLDIWKKAGPYAQRLVIKKVDSFSDEELIILRDLIVSLLDPILSTEVRGTRTNYNSLTISTATITSNEETRLIRHRCLEILQLLYKKTDSSTEKRQLISTMNSAARLPQRTSASQDLVRDVLLDSSYIAKFYANIAGDETYEILQTLEHDLLWWHRWNSGIRPPVFSREDVLNAKSDLEDSIRLFRDEIDKNNLFFIYKTLVGYESVFEPMWLSDDPEFDIKGIDEYRWNLIQTFVGNLTTETMDYWLSIIERCLETDSSDLATFIHFAKFLEEIGKKKPEIGLIYLNRLPSNERIYRASARILLGVSETSLSYQADDLISSWLTNGQHLDQVALYLRFTNSTDIDAIQTLMGKALERRELDLILSTLLIIFGRNHADITSVEDKVLIPALKFFVSNRSAEWVNAVWYMPTKTSMMASLSDRTFELMVDSICYLPRIEHHAERLVSVIGERNPALIVRLFDDRITLASADEELPEGYQALPYSLGDISDVLAMAPSELFSVCWRNYDGKQYAQRSWATRILSMAFPTLSEPLSNHLRDLIRQGSEFSLTYVALILREYDGDPCIDSLAKDLVEALSDDDELLVEVRIAVESSDVVSGEFGMVQLYKNRRDRVLDWMHDPREKVRRFATDFVHRLENNIAAEQKRAEDDIADRKAKYGGGDTDEN